VAENELIRVNPSGVVEERIKLPETMQKKFAAPDTNFGFEGVAIFKGHIWVVNDNDGAVWTRMVNAGKI
jgi:hypothetical protein